MLALTPGEPAGVGLDVTIKAFQVPRRVPLVVLTDPEVLKTRADLLGFELKMIPYLSHGDSVSLRAGEMSVLPVAMSGPVEVGKPAIGTVAGVLAALTRAVKGCLRGEFAGLVTGPMQKSIVNEAGEKFTGHTEFLAEQSGVEDVVMMLLNQRMRVALATTHVPLSEVPAQLTRTLLERRLRILAQDLEGRFRIDSPRILVAGLNPHAGESGYLGREELDTITPVCEILRAGGLDVVGPLPADTLFTGGYLAQADAVMVMYHDQGLPVLKYAGFGETVNVTLGLPFVRTSVDHGTALDVAGSGAANCDSLQASIEMAQTLIGS